MFGDKKTMWCHHLTKDGKLSCRTATQEGKSFKDDTELFAFLDKPKCCGRFAYDKSS